MFTFCVRAAEHRQVTASALRSAAQRIPINQHFVDTINQVNMEKAFVVSTTVAVVSSGLAAWAMYKWLETRDALIAHLDKYNDMKEVHRQLLHHYSRSKNLPKLSEIVPKEADRYHLQLAKFCSDTCDKHQVSRGRILDVGCGPGGTSFQLSNYFTKVVGTDVSYYMIAVAQQVKQFAEFASPFSTEGGNHISNHVIRVPDSADREKVEFWDEDMCIPSYKFGKFDCILVSNTLTDMHDPKCFLESIGDYASTGALMIIADVYNWKNGPEEALGGEGDRLTFFFVKENIISLLDF
ncbi:uncharacterized protein LOC122242532 isoform X2 [Penaeus japonicus]|uniref:uncharacterized protein LOC122242532 isoform X2 n=1 Tax=Penaeus japonicus TaxID=27405 RepID=UPI001C70EFA0|nr:uncharacterized protein LOC122242532 isoform X2 [Penaeus japonicus]